MAIWPIVGSRSDGFSADLPDCGAAGDAGVAPTGGRGARPFVVRPRVVAAVDRETTRMSGRRTRRPRHAIGRRENTNPRRNTSAPELNPPGRSSSPDLELGFVPYVFPRTIRMMKSRISAPTTAAMKLPMLQPRLNVTPAISEQGHPQMNAPLQPPM